MVERQTRPVILIADERRCERHRIGVLLQSRNHGLARFRDAGLPRPAKRRQNRRRAAIDAGPHSNRQRQLHIPRGRPPRGDVGEHGDRERDPVGRILGQAKGVENPVRSDDVGQGNDLSSVMFDDLGEIRPFFRVDVDGSVAQHGVLQGQPQHQHALARTRFAEHPVQGRKVGLASRSRHVRPHRLTVKLGIPDERRPMGLVPHHRQRTHTRIGEQPQRHVVKHRVRPAGGSQPRLRHRPHLPVRQHRNVDAGKLSCRQFVPVSVKRDDYRHVDHRRGRGAAARVDVPDTPESVDLLKLLGGRLLAVLACRVGDVKLIARLVPLDLPRRHLARL